jgi:hypothetical protein
MALRKDSVFALPGNPTFDAFFHYLFSENSKEDFFHDFPTFDAFFQTAS